MASRTLHRLVLALPTLLVAALVGGSGHAAPPAPPKPEAWPEPPFRAWATVPLEVRPDPKLSKRPVGFLTAGDTVEVTACVPSCSARYAVALIAPMGAVPLSRLRPLPIPDAFRRLTPDVPLRYGRVVRGGAPVFAAPDPATQVVELLGKPNLLVFLADPALEAQGWLRRPKGGFTRVENVKLLTPSTFAGVKEPTLPLAFVRSPTVVPVAADGTPGPTLVRYDTRPVLGGDWRKVQLPEGTVQKKDLRIARTHPRPPKVGPEDRWVHIDLGEQVLTAYEGDRPVFATLVSTGGLHHNTHTGVHRVTERYHTRQMRGHEEERYYVEEVPSIQFFYAGEALHGAYWHDGFGTPRSHGCVNLSMADAAWLFAWAPGPIPDGWYGVAPPRAGLPTLVVQVEAPNWHKPVAQSAEN